MTTWSEPLAFERTEIHETRYRGTLTGEQLHAIVLRGLRDKIGAPHYGLRLILRIDGEPVDLAGADFELVRDEDWFRKEDV